MDSNLPAVLTLAFGLGMLHALDADHIMAVSTLASTRSGRQRALAFCARWAIGHGLTLLTIGAAVLLLGMAIPARLSADAESLVGVVLVLIGAWVLWDLWRRRVHLHFHAHEGAITHAHWHLDQPGAARRGEHGHAHGHGAVLVGVMHGTAGSAPLLALLPMAQHGPWFGLGLSAGIRCRCAGEHDGVRRPARDGVRPSGEAWRARVPRHPHAGGIEFDAVRRDVAAWLAQPPP